MKDCVTLGCELEASFLFSLTASVRIWRARVPPLSFFLSEPSVSLSVFLSFSPSPNRRMSGENIYNLLGAPQPKRDIAALKDDSPPQYTGEYEKHMKEPIKPAYSTFYEKGKEYDSTHPRFFKQRDAIIGKSVADTVYPQNYLKKGEGVRAVVPPIHKEKTYTKPPVDRGNLGNAAGNGAAGSGDGAGANGGQGDGGDDNGNGKGADGGRGAGSNGAYSGFPGYGDYSGVMGVPKSRKNFIASNIVEMSNMVPKNRKDQPQYATDRKDFGRVPAYLSRVKQELATEQNFIQALEDRKSERRQQVYDQYVYRLPADEQADLVATLQKKLQQNKSALASMPFSLDTMSVAKKKGELERTIRDIETALDKLDKEAIFIYKDDPVSIQWAKSAALEEAKKYVASTTPAS